VPHEHSDIGLDSHIERSLATPYVKARLGNSELSNHFAKRRGRAEHRECTGNLHGIILGRVRADKPLEENQHLQSPWGES